MRVVKEKPDAHADQDETTEDQCIGKIWDEAPILTAAGSASGFRIFFFHEAYGSSKKGKTRLTLESSPLFFVKAHSISSS